MPVPAIGVSVHARTWDGPAEPPVVLVAGLGVSSRYWVRFGRRLAGRWRVLAPDLPGFGRTRRTPGVRWPGGPDAREQADQLLAWMDAWSVRRAVLIGQSVGCQAVVDLAGRFPDRVERLVLMAPPFGPGRRTFGVCLPLLMLGAWFEVPSLLPLLLVEYGSAGLPRAVQQAWRAMREPFEAKLSAVTVPTLVVHGEYDTVASRQWAERVAARLPRAALVVVDRVGHAMHYSAAAVTAAVVADFLNDALPEAGDGAAVVPVDDPRHDPHGPPQPLSPAVHGVLDYVAAAVTMGVSRRPGYGRRTRRLLAAAVAFNVVSNAASDHRAAVVRRLPMVTHASSDVGVGAALIVAAATWLRRERPAERWAVAAYGAFHIAAAALTAKPTGPVRSAGRSGRGELR